jgi:hypothetical protein
MVIQEIEPITPAQIEHNLVHDVYQHHAFNVNDHHYEGEYNFLESQRDREFVRSIARAFGNSEAVCLEIIKGQQDVDHQEEDGDLREEDGTLRVIQTKGWIDILVESGSGAIWEMKSPNRDNGTQKPLTQENQNQLFRYWQNMTHPRPRYLVLCNFRTFRIWDTHEAANENAPPLAEFGLEEIQNFTHMFPYFDTQNPNQLILDDEGDISELTAVALGRFYHSLIDSGIGTEIAVRFSIKSALIMYLEDFRNRDGDTILPRDENGRGIFFGTLLSAREDQNNAIQIFTLMNEFGNNDEGLFNVPVISEEWFGGGNITLPFNLTPNQIELLTNCAARNWRSINPMILGSFVEKCFTDRERLNGGIHFTRISDVMRIVQPLIVDYFQEMIDGVTGGVNQRFNQFVEILGRLRNFSVLEPAVGGGNFLYVAYREMRCIEDEIIRRIRLIPNRNSWLPVARLNSSNLYGLEIQEWSSWVARLTMAIGKCRFELTSNLPLPVLPLEDGECFAQIITCDALLDSNDEITIRNWPDVDVIIGNPPFNGHSEMRKRLGGEYVNSLHAAFENEGILPRRDIDYVCYWFLLAQRHLINGACRAFGFISTRAVIQKQSRTVLEYGLDNDLRISLAYRHREWEGDAGVYIAITCMERSDSPHVEGTRLAYGRGADLEQANGPINQYLSDDGHFYILFEPLNGQNDVAKQSIKGPFRGSGGGNEPEFEHLMRSRSLMLSNEQAEQMLQAENLEGGPENSDVVVRYMPNSYWEDRESEWIINFRDFDEQQAGSYLLPFQHLYDNGRREGIIHCCTEEIINPETGEGRRNQNYSAEYANAGFADAWWQIWRSRENETFRDLREAGSYFVKSQLLYAPSSNEFIHFEEIDGNCIVDGGMYILDLPHRWQIGILLSDFHRVWCEFTHGFNATANAPTWFPADVLEGFPFPQNASNEDIELLNESIDAYYTRINQLFQHDDFELLRDAIDHGSMNVYRANISTIVRRMYGLPEGGEITYQQIIGIKIQQWGPQEIERLSHIDRIKSIARVGDSVVENLIAQGWADIQSLSAQNAQSISENTPRFSEERAVLVMELVNQQLIPRIQGIEALLGI